MVLCSGANNLPLLRQIEKREATDQIQLATNLHMLCVKGPRNILPTESIICWPKQIMIASHPAGDNETVSFISVFTKEQHAEFGRLDTPTTSSTSSIGTINPVIIQTALNILFRVSPQIAKGRDSLQWQAYSGWKMEHPTVPQNHWVPHCEGKIIFITNQSNFSKIFANF